MIWLLLACVHPHPPDSEAPVMVALRAESMAGLNPNLHPDAGLRAAAEELIAGATRVGARLTPGAMRVALGRSGYPRDARFLRAHSPDATIPQALLEAIPDQVGVDIGWASRPDAAGGATWIVGWAPRIGTLDPIPRDIALDQGLPLRTDGLVDPRLFIGSPDGRAQELAMTDGTARWLDVFHVPGEYRVEVVEGDRVAYLFSLFVDAAPLAASPLPGPAERQNASTVAADLAARVNDLRVSTGLAPLRPFARLEPETIAQAACLASTGEVAHSTPRCPGVPAMAERSYHPRARHHEDVVAADTTEESWERLFDSPGHRLNLLCPSCTHLTVGAATEATDPARVFTVIELMEFPEGEPVPIIRGRR